MFVTKVIDYEAEARGTLSDPGAVEPDPPSPSSEPDPGLQHVASGLLVEGLAGHIVLLGCTFTLGSFIALFYNLLIVVVLHTLLDPRSARQAEPHHINKLIRCDCGVFYS